MQMHAVTQPQHNDWLLVSTCTALNNHLYAIIPVLCGHHATGLSRRNRRALYIGNRVCELEPSEPANIHRL